MADVFFAIHGTQCLFCGIRPRNVNGSSGPLSVCHCRTSRGLSCMQKLSTSSALDFELLTSSYDRQGFEFYWLQMARRMGPPPPKRRPPTRILKAGKKITKRRQDMYVRTVSKTVTDVNNNASYDTNVSELPLLSLPAEVRNRIWRFVFGGNVVHVGHKTRNFRLQHQVCKRAEDDH